MGSGAGAYNGGRAQLTTVHLIAQEFDDACSSVRSSLTLLDGLSRGQTMQTVSHLDGLCSTQFWETNNSLSKNHPHPPIKLVSYMLLVFLYFWVSGHTSTQTMGSRAAKLDVFPFISLQCISTSSKPPQSSLLWAFRAQQDFRSRTSQGHERQVGHLGVCGTRKKRGPRPPRVGCGGRGPRRFLRCLRRQRGEWGVTRRRRAATDAVGSQTVPNGRRW